MKTNNPVILRLTKVRQWLKSQALDGYLVPRSDEFLGEYVPASAERLLWLTGFTGSWGMAVIAPKIAALVVDGRYTVQAAQETKGLDVQLLAPGNAALGTFASQAFPKAARIGFDPWIFSITEASRLKALFASKGMALIPNDENAVDAIWTDRPPSPTAPIYEHPQRYAGQSSTEKRFAVAELVNKSGCAAVVITDPHSIAWLLNIRGSDINHTPIALLRAVLDKAGKATVYVDRKRLPPELINSWGKAVNIRPPGIFVSHLAKLAIKKTSKLRLDPATCPEAIRNIITAAGAQIVEAEDPCSLLRARKNRTEQKGSRAAHLRDGAALANFLCWLHKEAPAGKLTERAAQDQLLAFRKATGKLVDLSFGTISAAGPNAALPHYHVSNNAGRKIKNNEIYLVDSGGQYRDGTTDVTRTVIVGKATKQMQLHNTLVLKGMIAVSTACFPVGTTGAQLDALARFPMWKHGFDFDHGTGHGVGSFLSVHEGPARISKAGHVALEPGMIVSNEPGYYQPGHYGIRIENLLLVKPATKPRDGNRPMLSFETLTFAPIDKNLIDASILTKAELVWLDEYHNLVWQKIGPRVEAKTKPWLKIACEPFKAKA